MTVANHLTLNELRRRAKKAKDPIEKDRFLAVYHAKRGLTAKEIARIIPNTPRWVQETVRRYNLEGPEALKDKRHQNPGQKPKLTPEERMRVLEALQGPPPDGGLWTGPKLRDWVERELGKRLSLYPIYRLLHEMGFALRPRPRHRKADGEAPEASNLFAQVQEARAEGRRVRLLAYDWSRPKGVSWAPLGSGRCTGGCGPGGGRGPWRWGRTGTGGSTCAPLWNRRRGRA
jgi:transposase